MNNNAIEKFINAVKEPEYETNTTYSAVVSRVDNEGVAWVNLAGSEKETPTASTSADVKAGDVVTVQWRNNKLYIAGNYSDPSAGVIRVANVEAAANTAREAANNAVADAGRARDAAEQAEATAASVEGIAQRAESAATNAIKSLAQVEDVVDTLNWIATHCQYEKTTDTTIVTGKAYYTVTATQVSSPADADIATYYELVSGAYVKTADTSVVSGKTYYTVVGEPVANPVVADIGTYYELEITEAVSNYINTHVAVTNEGLWLIPDDTQGSSKVLIAVGGQGHTYEDAGTYVIDGSDNVLAKFLASGVQIGQSDGANTVIDANGQRTYAGNGNVLISNIGYGDVGDASGVIGQYPYYTMGWRDNLSNAQPYDSTATYKAGDACIYDGKIYVTRQDITTPEAWNSTKWRYYIGAYSVAEGYSTVASGSDSHAEGTATKAVASEAHAEGYYTIARGGYAHAEGNRTIAGGLASHTQNEGTETAFNAQTVMGTYNTKDARPTTAVHPNGSAGYGNYALIIGNGTADGSRSNAMTLDWKGNLKAYGTISDSSGRVARVLTESHSASVTVPASNAGTLSVNMAKSGYTCVGIVGVQPTGSGSSMSYIYGFYMVGNTAYVYFRNTTATARTFTTYVTGLYVKS